MATSTFTTTTVPFQSPPNTAKSNVTAPPIPPISFLLSVFNSGLSNTADLLNAIDLIPSFNWQNQADIDARLVPGKRLPLGGKDVDFWASAKQKPWNAKNSLGTADKQDNNTTSAYVGPVLNQGTLGICYAVSSTDSLSIRTAIQNDLDNSKNQQLFNIAQVVNCSSDSSIHDTAGGPCIGQNQNCQGGWPACVGEYVKSQGLTKNQAPNVPMQNYVNCVNGGPVCSNIASANVTYPIPQTNAVITLPNGQKEQTQSIINYVQYYNSEGKLVDPVPNPTDTERKELQRYMKMHLLSQGPYPICFYVDESQSDLFMQYSGGVFTGSAQGTPNHAVLLVGWGTSTSGPYIGQYWIVKNSWSTSWGDTQNPGYFNFAMSTSTVNTGYGLDYPQLQLALETSSATASFSQQLQMNGSVQPQPNNDSKCMANQVMINGECYNMFGGGTGFLVQGQSVIDVPQVPVTSTASSGAVGVAAPVVSPITNVRGQQMSMNRNGQGQMQQSSCFAPRVGSSQPQPCKGRLKIRILVLPEILKTKTNPQQRVSRQTIMDSYRNCHTNNTRSCGLYRVSDSKMLLPEYNRMSQTIAADPNQMNLDLDPEQVSHAINNSFKTSTNTIPIVILSVLGAILLAVILWAVLGATLKKSPGQGQGQSQNEARAEAAYQLRNQQFYGNESNVGTPLNEFGGVNQ